jgi:hypothetical protein
MYAGFAGAKTGHGRMTLNRRFLVPPLHQPGFATLASLHRCHQRTVFAVRSEYTVETCQIESGFGHQGGQLGNEIHRLEDDVHGRTNAAGAWMRRSGHVGGAIPIRRLQLIADLTLIRQ